MGEFFELYSEGYLDEMGEYTGKKVDSFVRLAFHYDKAGRKFMAKRHKFKCQVAKFLKTKGKDPEKSGYHILRAFLDQVKPDGRSMPPRHTIYFELCRVVVKEYWNEFVEWCKKYDKKDENIQHPAAAE